MTEISTPDLLPCPFCASTRVGLDDSVGGSFVSCDLCEARGPSVEYELIDHLEGISRAVSVAPSGDAIDPSVKIACQSNGECMELRQRVMRDASAAAIAAWNQRNITFKPLP
jgi:hypothetical protein